MVVRHDIAVLRQNEAAADAVAILLPDAGFVLHQNVADRVDVHFIDLCQRERLFALVGRKRFRQRRPLEPVGGLILRVGRLGLRRFHGLLGHGADGGVLLLLGEIFLPDGVDGLRQRRAADARDDRHGGQQRRNLESGVLAAAPDLLLRLFQRLLGCGRRFG